MPRPRDKTVNLKKFFDSLPDSPTVRVMEFDADEWVKVLPYGMLEVGIHDRVNAALEAREDSTEKRDAWMELRYERARRLVLDWNLHRLDGNGDYASPVKAGARAFLDLPPDLFAAVETVIFGAYNQREDSLERLGEGNGSAAPSSDDVEMVASTPSS